jgi:hypothetical protein
MKKIYQIVLIIVLIGIVSFSVGADSQWRRLFQGSVSLFCYEQDMHHGRTVISMVDDALSDLTEWYGLSESPKITIVLTPSQKSFHQLTGGQIPEWGIAAASPDQSIVFLKSPRIARPETDLKKVIVHELSHVLLFTAAGGKHIERWFDEGLAMMLSGEKGLRETVILARAVLSGDIIWLHEIDDVLTFHRQKADLAYHESLVAVTFLKDQYSREVFREIIYQLSQDRDMDAAMQSVIGLHFGEFEGNWLRAMQKKYRWAVFLNFPFLLSVLMVALFLSAVVATRIRIKKRRRLWEKEDFYEFETAEDHSTSG